MSPLEGYPHGRADGPFVPLQEKGGRLLPMPPIGQLSIPEVMAADSRGLEEIAHIRGIEPEQLFKPNVWKQMQGGVRNRNSWPFEDRIRLGLMYIDGKTMTEIGTAMKVKFPTTDQHDLERRIITSMHNWFSPFAKDLAKANRKARIKQTMLEVPTQEVEKKIAALEQKFNLKRTEIFERPLSPTPRKGALNIYSVPVGIHVLYRRFVEGADKPTIMNEVEDQIGREITIGDVDTFYTRALTDKAKDVFGLRGRNDSWGK